MAGKCDPVRLMQQSGSRGWIGDKRKSARRFAPSCPFWEDLTLASGGGTSTS
jgi:hypothetical protein